MDSDINRFLAIKNGDRKVFETLFRDFYVRLCVYAESILHDNDEAKDIVQQVFVQLWEKRESLTITGTWKSYLYSCVYNASMNLIKHEKVRRDFIDFMRENQEDTESQIEILFQEEQQERLMTKINSAIEGLPPQCKEIFLLSRFSGKKSADIAKILKISTRTVETQLYRSMKHLRMTLKDIKEDLILFFSCKKREK
ncbi:RNA polymerase sigma-70 factor [uncultured Butyricimonas sp.]|uniref:RNA polymerase sigma-70 factor n=1 Tax=uncultured Butyricimonas sp. TaxID=1268785 RepID=UPI0026DC7B91|nr:RNA polymerase sigma-70 factor [uncultured Butyricimonas sp.]